MLLARFAMYGYSSVGDFGPTAFPPPTDRPKRPARIVVAHITLKPIRATKIADHQLLSPTGPQRCILEGGGGWGGTYVKFRQPYPGRPGQKDLTLLPGLPRASPLGRAKGRRSLFPRFAAALFLSGCRLWTGTCRLPFLTLLPVYPEPAHRGGRRAGAVCFCGVRRGLGGRACQLSTVDYELRTINYD